MCEKHEQSHHILGIEIQCENTTQKSAAACVRKNIRRPIPSCLVSNRKKWVIFFFAAGRNQKLYVSVCLPLKRSCFYLRMGNEYESISVRCIGFCGQLLGFEGQADGAIRHKRPDDAMVLLMLRQAGVVFLYCAKVRVNVEKLLNHQKSLWTDFDVSLILTHKLRNSFLSVLKKNKGSYFVF